MFCQGEVDEMTETSSEGTARKWRKPKQARSLKRVNRILAVAEEMLIEKGYAATTTKEIASQAEVPIGSLYQFFPDKAAILQALAERYTDLLDRRLKTLEPLETSQLSLANYVDRLTDLVEEFFDEYPGYRAIFMEVQGTMPELDEAGDVQLIQTLATLLPQSDASLSQDDREAISFVLVKAIGNLQWLSLGQTPELRQRLSLEARRLALHYLQSYLV